MTRRNRCWSALGVGCGVLSVIAAAVALSGCASPKQRSDAPVQIDDAPKEERDRVKPGVITFAGAPGLEVKKAPTGHLLVRPTINGQEAGWFIFDTGAGICCISTPKVQALGLRGAGGIDAVGVGGGQRAELYRADSVRLGPVSLTDHPMMAVDFGFLTPFLGEDIGGVIGYGIISQCAVEMDLKEARIALHDPKTFELASLGGAGAWCHLVVRNRIPVVPATYEGHTGLFRLDTGANRYVTFHQPATQRLRLLEGRQTTDAHMGGVGGMVKGRKGRIAWFELGGVRQENITAEFATEAKGSFGDAGIDGNIGAQMLEPFVMVLDYPNQRAAFVQRR